MDIAKKISNKTTRILSSFLRFILIVGISFIILYPIIVKFFISLKSPADLLDNSLIYFSRTPSFSSFKNAMSVMNYKNAFIDSALISLISGLLHVFSCTLVGYGLGRFKFKFKGLISALVILTLIVPPQTISIPVYMNFQNFFGFANLLNNPTSLFLLYATANSLKSGLYIFLLSSYFRNMPKELEDAALVDGASLTKTLTAIMLPSAKAIMITVFLFTFVWQWTDLYYSSMFLRDYNLLSIKLSVLAETFRVQFKNSHPLMVSQINNSGSLLFILPIVVLYAFCTRYFVEGIERSGLVG